MLKGVNLGTAVGYGLYQPYFQDINIQGARVKNTIQQYESRPWQVGRLENAIGWYHSHPGYGCWLSGIDVGTQMVNQQFQEPFVAIVVSVTVKQ